jgi:hypothetical protein
LAEGFTVEDLKLACEGVFKIPFNMGENSKGRRYIDLELVCRDASHVEKVAEAATSNSEFDDIPKPFYDGEPSDPKFAKMTPDERAANAAKLQEILDGAYDAVVVAS